MARLDLSNSTEYDEGQSVIEYALVLALVSVLIVATLATVAAGAMGTLASRIAGAVV